MIHPCPPPELRIRVVLLHILRWHPQRIDGGSVRKRKLKYMEFMHFLKSLYCRIG